MSNLDQRSRTGLVFRRLASLAHRLQSRLDDHRERTRMAAELSTASDRELGELGYSRADVVAIARGTYQR
jgi:uncharacterized protein YjiS (DUF1127 family)